MHALQIPNYSEFFPFLNKFAVVSFSIRNYCYCFVQNLEKRLVRLVYENHSPIPIKTSSNSWNKKIKV